MDTRLPMSGMTEGGAGEDGGEVGDDGGRGFSPILRGYVLDPDPSPSAQDDKTKRSGTGEKA